MIAMAIATAIAMAMIAMATANESARNKKLTENNSLESYSTMIGVDMAVAI